MEDMKPCPDCQSVDLKEEMIWYRRPRLFAIVCNNCGKEGPSSFGYPDKNPEDKWNGWDARDFDGKETSK